MEVEFIKLTILILGIVFGFVLSLYLFGMFLKLVPKKIAIKMIVSILLFTLWLVLFFKMPLWLFVIGLFAFLAWMVFMMLQSDPEFKKVKQLIFKLKEF